MANPEWNKIRPWNGSQETAFEELVCQLASQEPIAGTFTRKGTPDGGVEGFWIRDNGKEIGYQAKFFTKVPTAAQWTQIEDSISTALATHPNLEQYVIAMPVDPPDPRLEGKTSMMDQWDKLVKAWSKMRERKHVKFVRWGSFELGLRLMEDKNAGLRRFWFNETILTDAWFQQHLSEATAAAGARYTPEASVDLPIAAAFDGLGRRAGSLARVPR